jgi:hypothetical protein
MEEAKLRTLIRNLAWALDDIHSYSEPPYRGVEDKDLAKCHVVAGDALELVPDDLLPGGSQWVRNG